MRQTIPIIYSIYVCICTVSAPRILTIMSFVVFYQLRRVLSDASATVSIISHDEQYMMCNYYVRIILLQIAYLGEGYT
jgi:hypothetical protein